MPVVCAATALPAHPVPPTRAYAHECEANWRGILQKLPMQAPHLGRRIVRTIGVSTVFGLRTREEAMNRGKVFNRCKARDADPDRMRLCHAVAAIRSDSAVGLVLRCDLTRDYDSQCFSAALLKG